MQPSPKQALISVLLDIFEKKGKFFVAFFLIFAVTYGFLYAVDFIPETPEENEREMIEEEIDESEVTVRPNADAAPYPERIVIDALGKDIDVLNPQSREIEDLDAALLNGVVRHPDSADFTDEGNMFLFGHSSYLPVVYNKNYQAFNGLQELVWGDLILVESSDTEYTYRVTKVYKVKASEAEIALDHSKSKLTLVTCNSFGSKDDRFVVEADLISKKSI